LFQKEHNGMQYNSPVKYWVGLSKARISKAPQLVSTTEPPCDYGYDPFPLNPDTSHADITAAGEFEGSALNTQRPPAIIFRLVALCFSEPPQLAAFVIRPPLPPHFSHGADRFCGPGRTGCITFG